MRHSARSTTFVVLLSFSSSSNNSGESRHALKVKAQTRTEVCVIKMETPLHCWEHRSLSLEMPCRVPERLPVTLTKGAPVETETTLGINRRMYYTFHSSFSEEIFCSEGQLFSFHLTFFLWSIIFIYTGHIRCHLWTSFMPWYVSVPQMGINALILHTALMGGIKEECGKTLPQKIDDW